jgi:PST family polysaccharide transporter
MTSTEGAPTKDNSSYGGILANTAIIGGASVVNILVGLVRGKMIAILVGPGGVGFMGLLNGVLSVVGAVAEAGITTVGTRQIAEAYARDKTPELAAARHTLLLTCLFLSAVGAALLWLSRDIVAQFVLHDPQSAPQVGLLAIGVVFSIATGAQTAVIRGMRRTNDLAKISMGSALVATLVGVPLVWWLRTGGIAWYVIMVPASTFALGHWFVRRLPKHSTDVTLPELVAQTMALVRQGLPFASSSISVALIQIWIRTDVSYQLGPTSLGYFQASWAIAAQYLSVVLGAMAADYYPKLAGIMEDKVSARRLVNEQTEVALLLGGVAIIVMLAAAPLIIRLLYTAEFAPAADMLRWQAFADVLKVASWPLGFVILAAGAGRTYFVTETSALLVMAGAIHLLLPSMGVAAGGLGYLISYLFYLPLVFVLAGRYVGFRWSPEAGGALLLLVGLCSAVLAINALAPGWSQATGAAAAAIYAAFAFTKLRRIGIFTLVASTIAGLRNGKE